MQIELFVHSALPGKIEAMLRVLRESIAPLREQYGARLVFATAGDSGPMGEVVMAWAHASLEHLASFNLALESDSKWHTLKAEIGSLMRAQTLRVLDTTSFSTVELPPAGTRLIDLRCYTFRPGGLATFLPICATNGLPGQLRHCGNLIFHSTSRTGSTEDLVQAWAYKGFDQYNQGQRALFHDPDWALNYRERVLHLVDIQDHRYLQMLAWSPLKANS